MPSEVIDSPGVSVEDRLKHIDNWRCAMSKHKHYFDYWQQHGEEKIKEAIEALEDAAKAIEDVKPVFRSSMKSKVVSNCAGETIRKLVAHLKSKPAATLVKETWG
jgi:hypothetical protein